MIKQKKTKIYFTEIFYFAIKNISFGKYIKIIHSVQYVAH